MDITRTTLAANQLVNAGLAKAAGHGAIALEALEAGSRMKDVRTSILGAVRELDAATAGARALRRQGADLLDPAAHRNGHLAASEARTAAEILGRGRLTAATKPILHQRITELEIRARLATEAGSRSLANPKLRAAPIESAGGGAAERVAGPTYLAESGTWVDELGSPLRGHGDTWVGNEGAMFDSGGGIASSRGWVDSHTGESYAGGHFL